MIEHAFGGDWTEDKLRRLREYLIQYRSIFTKNPRARYFTTWYVDAFAGTGSRTPPGAPKSLADANAEDDAFAETDVATFFDGSAKIALGIPSPFDRYLFIEGSRRKANALRETITAGFTPLNNRIQIETNDANAALREWSQQRDWSKERAVVFLDPYGMQVDWETVRLLGNTKAIDLWYLFPLGGVIRMLTKDGSMDESWQARLDSVFGVTDWRDHFYRAASETDLFGTYDVIRRDATVSNVLGYVEGRLKTSFVAVAPSLVLYNSCSAPLFAFCFAAANERGAMAAISIATYLLRDDKEE